MIGDIVVARKVPAEMIKIGDIITYRNGGITIVHRVENIDNYASQITFITQSDANNSEDAPQPAINYQSKVIFSIPKLDG